MTSRVYSRAGAAIFAMENAPLGELD